MKIETIPLIAAERDVGFKTITYTVHLPNKKDYEIAFIIPEANITTTNLVLVNTSPVKLEGQLLDLKFVTEHYIAMGDVRQYKVGDIVANCIVVCKHEPCGNCKPKVDGNRGYVKKALNPGGSKKSL